MGKKESRFDKKARKRGDAHCKGSDGDGKEAIRRQLRLCLEIDNAMSRDVRSVQLQDLAIYH